MPSFVHPFDRNHTEPDTHLGSTSSSDVRQYPGAWMPAFLYGRKVVRPRHIAGDGTAHVIGSAAVQDGYPAPLDESLLLEHNDARVAHYVSVDSIIDLGEFDGVAMVTSYQSGGMEVEARLVRGTSKFGYSSCETFGRCVQIAPLVSRGEEVARGMYPGSACTGSGRGLCYESSIGTLECGRTIETWSNLGRGPEDAFVVNTAPKIWNGTELPRTVRACPRGTANLNGGATGTIIHAPRLLIAGCMLSNDTKYEPSADVHVPHFCARPAHYKRGCLFAGALNYEPGSRESGFCRYPTLGCTSSTALNFYSLATHDDGSCIEPIPGALIATDDLPCMQVLITALSPLPRLHTRVRVVRGRGE